MFSATNFTSTIATRFNYYKQLADKTFAQLSEDEMHWRPTAESNSIAIIMQHLYGNMMSRFTHFLTEDGEKLWRKRDAEFEPMELTKQDLLDCWETGWSLVLSSIQSLSEAELMQTVYIRSEPLTAFDAILRQLAHYSYHVGQIVCLGKMMKNENWNNLSVQKGGSAAFNEAMRQQQQLPSK